MKCPAELKSATFRRYLTDTIKGYHVINEAPIKEAVWENILTQALKRSAIPFTWNCGGHQSGADVVINDSVGISCKSCKDSKTHLKISSYRMTKCNSPADFVQCIDHDRANFAFYGIITRAEDPEHTTYAIYMIPSELVKAGDLEWTEVMNRNKTAVNKTAVTEWKSNTVDGVQMSVKKSMSNQLWITLTKERFREYCIVQDISVPRHKHIDYASIVSILDLLPQLNNLSLQTET